MKRICFYFGVLLLLSACTFHGVDPNIPYRYAELTATPMPTEVVVEEPQQELTPLPGEAGVDEPSVQPTDETCELVKGNIDASGRKLYHVPGMPNYNRVKIDTSKGEKFFCTEQEAKDAGWVKAGG